MTDPHDTADDPEVPALRQEVVDELVRHLGQDDREAFASAEARLGATRAEVAAASAGLVETGGLDLATLEHTLEVLEDVAQLPDPGGSGASGTS